MRSRGLRKKPDKTQNDFGKTQTAFGQNLAVAIDIDVDIDVDIAIDVDVAIDVAIAIDIDVVCLCGKHAIQNPVKSVKVIVKVKVRVKVRVRVKSEEKKEKRRCRTHNVFYAYRVNSANPVIASQCSHWRGNPPAGGTETLGNLTWPLGVRIATPVTSVTGSQ